MEKKELIQFTITNNSDCNQNVQLFSKNPNTINATKKYSWLVGGNTNIYTVDDINIYGDLTTCPIGSPYSCGVWSIIINGSLFPISFNGTLKGAIDSLNKLGFGLFCSEANTTTTTSTTTAIPTTTTTTVIPTTTSTTTSTTTAVPTTTTTTTAIPTTTTSTSTTTSTTTAVPTTTTTTSTSTSTTTTTAVPTTLAMPSITISETNNIYTEISWDDVANADFYEIQRSSLSNYSDATTVFENASNHHFDTFPLSNTTYYYRIRSMSSSGNIANSFDSAKGTSLANSAWLNFQITSAADNLHIATMVADRKKIKCDLSGINLIAKNGATFTSSDVGKVVVIQKGRIYPAYKSLPIAWHGFILEVIAGVATIGAINSPNGSPMGDMTSQLVDGINLDVTYGTDNYSRLNADIASAISNNKNGVLIPEGEYLLHPILNVVYQDIYRPSIQAQPSNNLPFNVVPINDTRSNVNAKLKIIGANPNNKSTITITNDELYGRGNETDYKNNTINNAWYKVRYDKFLQQHFYLTKGDLAFYNLSFEGQQNPIQVDETTNNFFTFDPYSSDRKRFFQYNVDFSKNNWKGGWNAGYSFNGRVGEGVKDIASFTNCNIENTQPIFANSLAQSVMSDTAGRRLIFRDVNINGTGRLLKKQSLQSDGYGIKIEKINDTKYKIEILNPNISFYDFNLNWYFSVKITVRVAGVMYAFETGTSNPYLNEFTPNIVYVTSLPSGCPITGTYNGIVQDTIYGGQVIGHTMYIISRSEYDAIGLNVSQCYQNVIRINSADRFTNGVPNFTGEQKTFCIKNYTYEKVTPANNAYPQWINFWSDIGYIPNNGYIDVYGWYGYMDKDVTKKGVYKNSMSFSCGDGGIPVSCVENINFGSYLINFVIGDGAYSTFKGVNGTFRNLQGGSVYLDNSIFGSAANQTVAANAISYTGNNSTSEFYIKNALVCASTMVGAMRKHILQNSEIGGGGLYFNGANIASWMLSGTYEGGFTNVKFVSNKQINANYNFPIVSDATFTKVDFDSYSNKTPFVNVTADASAASFFLNFGNGIYSSFYYKLTV